MHLGANRLLVVGTRTDAATAPADGGTETPPSPGHLLGFVLDSLFTDGLSIDIERLRQINDLIAEERLGLDPGRRPIEGLVVQPSEDPTAIARRHLRAMPRSLRVLLRTIGAREARRRLRAGCLLLESYQRQKLMEFERYDA